jgi:Fe-S oxidoreductase
VPILRDPADKVSDDAEAVFYFPGCGSERLFSDIGLATLAMLFDQGVQTVLPPGYLCCGYPQRAAGQGQSGQQITMENRVLFHRVANTLNYLDIRTVVVSCGTCMDQLLKYEFERIFPGCRLLDIHEYLMEKGVGLERRHRRAVPLPRPLPHADEDLPAHLGGVQAHGQEVPLSDRCCGEAGTLGTARPDIANQVRFRKARGTHPRHPRPHRQATAPSPARSSCSPACPACQQGLAKYADETGLTTDYIVVELARHLLGEAGSSASSSGSRTAGWSRCASTPPLGERPCSMQRMKPSTTKSSASTPRGAHRTGRCQLRHWRFVSGK